MLGLSGTQPQCQKSSKLCGTEWPKESEAGLIPLEYGDTDFYSTLTLRDLLKPSELGCICEFLGSQTIDLLSQ